MFELKIFTASFIADKFAQTFIEEDRWKTFASGLGVTLLITFFAAILGIIIGMTVAVGKVWCYQSGRLKILDRIFDVYLTVIRGTPTLVQLLIMYFIILKSVDNGIIIAILAFGINSGAYVAEIVRGGILGIDKGQMEAGRSLGLSAWTTMRKIILPQAIKNILPALGNEFITLLKETSVVGYIAITDLTKAAVAVQARTYDAMFPLVSIALIYLLLVTVMTWLQRKVERRLAKSDRR
jgi:His/Glu/Gln/Arg/opine family amino acid ABC transporter permease subunit